MTRYFNRLLGLRRQNDLETVGMQDDLAVLPPQLEVEQDVSLGVPLELHPDHAWLAIARLAAEPQASNGARHGRQAERRVGKGTAGLEAAVKQRGGHHPSTWTRSR